MSRPLLHICGVATNQQPYHRTLQSSVQLAFRLSDVRQLPGDCFFKEVRRAKPSWRCRSF
ncbi:uncharacterized protein RSE6_03250 [Rhynchosporium secalis]|uniref:Uncharacterized protein n=1 Tax=Rhynchosporium secalis TaxID=38038 RepID=A0A1E1M2A6_RHYSE|nr:uncharacterized protein RSE6_03250 [Rhynchosporium secalis]